MKSRTVSKEWGRLIIKGAVKVKYGKGNAEWVFDTLGWKRNARK